MARSKAATFLMELRRLRLTRRIPAHGVFVTTSESWTQLFEEMGLATTEVWRRDLETPLDWGAIAGLRVTVVTDWWDQAQRMALFDAIRADEPAQLDWYAIERGTGKFLGQMRLLNGEPQLMENPLLLRQLFEMPRRPQSKRNGLSGELENRVNDEACSWNFWKEAHPSEIKERLEKCWMTYGQV